MTNSNPTAEPDRHPSSFPVLLFGLLCLIPSLGFVIYRLAVPSDGAHLSSDQTYTLPLGMRDLEGVVVSPYESADTPLQEGDVILAVDGVPMEVWLYSNFTAGSPGVPWEPRRTIRYEVLRGRDTLTLEFDLVRLPWREILSERWGALLFAFVSQIVAGFVFWKRRDDAAARALFIWAFSGSHTYAWSVFLQVGDIYGQTGFWLFHGATPLLWLIYWPASTHVALVFPRPFEIVQRNRRLVPGLYLASFALFTIAMAWTRVRSESYLDWHSTWGSIDSVIAAVFLAATMVVIVLQYRRVRTFEEKLQVRWVIFGALIAGVGGLVLWLLAPLLTGRSVINANFLGLMNLPFPVFLAAAIWRYRLFDIDVIIRRTLQYSITTLLLAGLYFIGVVVLQALVGSLAGNPDTPLITVLTTLGIASLFNPLRIRVQDFIDRRFFRTSYDAELILEQFAAAARDEVDIELLSVALMGVIDETMQPRRISLWLSQTPS